MCNELTTELSSFVQYDKSNNQIAYVHVHSKDDKVPPLTCLKNTIGLPARALRMGVVNNSQGS